MDVLGLGYLLGPHEYLRAMQNWPHPWPGRSGPGTLTTGKLILPLASYSTWENPSSPITQDATVELALFVGVADKPAPRS